MAVVEISPCGAGLVEHDEPGLAAQPLFHERDQLARHDVGAAAGRKADHHLDRPVLGPSRQGGLAQG
jgi:hypothetical protein